MPEKATSWTSELMPVDPKVDTLSGTSAERLRIFYLVEGLHRGGAEWRCLRMARSLDSEQFDVVGIGTLSPGGALETEASRAGLRIVPFHRRGRFDPTPVARLARYMHAQRVDVIHSMGWLSNLVAMLATPPRRRLAVVGSTIFPTYDYSRGGKYRLAADRMLIHRMDCMVANSYALGEYLRNLGFPRERLAVVPNGVDIPDGQRLAPGDRLAARAALHLPADAMVIGTVGRLVEAKDHVTFLCAARLVLARYPQARFVIAGEGAERPHLERLVDQNGLGRAVVLLGEVDSAARVLPALSIFVLSSRYEGMPNALLEAGAWGLPLVSTSVSGATEIIEHGQTGLLCPIGDSVTLAEQLCTLLDNPRVASRLGQAAREHVEREFSTTTMIGRYASVYQSVAWRQTRRGKHG